MSVIKYDKLVRDRIPEIIEASGKTCKTVILDDAEYLRMLDSKLDEELTEYHKDQNIFYLYIDMSDKRKSDLRDKYAKIGRNRREENPDDTSAGRKGIGKLAALYLSDKY